MSLLREQKVIEVKEINEKISKSQSMVVATYQGLTVKQIQALRKEAKTKDVEIKVYKNRLLKIAFEDLGIKFDSSCYDGTTALATSADVVAPAKITFDGETKYKVMKAKAGYIEGKVMNYNEVKAIASIPSKDVLVAQLLGLLLNPIRSLAVVLDQAAKKNA